MTRMLNLLVKHYCTTCFPVGVGEVIRAHKRLPNGRSSGECVFCRRMTKRRVARLRTLSLGEGGEEAGLPYEVYRRLCGACGENFHKGEATVFVKPDKPWHVRCAEKEGRKK